MDTEQTAKALALALVQKIERGEATDGQPADTGIAQALLARKMSLTECQAVLRFWEQHGLGKADIVSGQRLRLVLSPDGAKWVSEGCRPLTATPDDGTSPSSGSRPAQTEPMLSKDAANSTPTWWQRPDVIAGIVSAVAAVLALLLGL